MPVATDPFAAKRAAMRQEFFAKLFLLGGWIGATDTRSDWNAEGATDPLRADSMNTYTRPPFALALASTIAAQPVCLSPSTMPRAGTVDQPNSAVMAGLN